MKRPFIASFVIIVLLLLTLFIFQNIRIVDVTFVVWNGEFTLSIILLTFFLVGFFLMLLIAAPSLLGKRKAIEGSNKKVDVLINEKVELTSKIEQLMNENSLLRDKLNQSTPPPSDKENYLPNK